MDYFDCKDTRLRIALDSCVTHLFEKIIEERQIPWRIVIRAKDAEKDESWLREAYLYNTDVYIGQDNDVKLVAAVLDKVFIVIPEGLSGMCQVDYLIKNIEFLIATFS